MWERVQFQIGNEGRPPQRRHSSKGIKLVKNQEIKEIVEGEHWQRKGIAEQMPEMEDGQHTQGRVRRQVWVAGSESQEEV